jgi:hypothetical protein
VGFIGGQFMSASVNPDIVTDGLVLCLDAANSDCFRGEPTTNLITSYFVDYYANYSSVVWSNEIDQYGNTRSLRKATINSTSGWTRVGIPSSIGIPVINQNYTISMWIKRLGSTEVRAGWEPEVGGADGYRRPEVESGYYGIAGGTQPNVVSDEWTYITYTFKYTSTTTSNVLLLFYINGNGGQIIFSDPQVEAKSYPTPFVNGTRGSTVATGGGLVDLSGNDNNNATITRTATPASSFYSEENKGLWVFDGSTDRINLIEAPDRLADSCTEVWFKSNGSQGTQRSMIFGYEHAGSNFSETVTGPITLLSNNKIKATVITSTEVYRSVTSNTTINNNQFYHVCLNKDTVNGILSLYINGIFEISNTFDADNLSYWAGLYRGRNYVEIGGYYNSGSTTAGVGGNLNGSIGICKMYNRTLEPYEMQKNYNALKGRYGL